MPDPGAPLRIVLADDHPVVRSGVRSLLEGSARVRIVAEAATAEELFAAVAREPADLVITDFSMPGGGTADGLSMLARLRLRWPELPVLVLTVAANVDVLRSILATGVLGLLNKSDALAELTLAVAAVSHRRSYLGAGIRRLFEDMGADGGGIGPGESLSRREIEVLRLFASGLTVSEIARRLSRSVKTVSRQKMDAMAKLGLRNDLEIYAYARRHGLLP
ncbi:DNA-binding response regulator [Pseudoxanthomonas broegbernensis]|uniref:DNA-binding response regulator n=1 Tax=Pseudoxanthomonas broegbernensis TaxID=83619 RepID=A0A7V8K660_9GAMM|nr:response regulator transcription factor [Pseudoxanthomonas broegbernensis]KAF1684761.1 DNA-binding response regulator [Pseudoxanthomonas broegbernensis]MBB6064181.1 two-component system capsular synthesis response regulator RcsB [Pseudoxanthomonas broegbernensis]